VNRRVVLRGGTLALLAAATAPARAASARTVVFASAGRSVALDVSAPEGSAYRPAVLLLHGRGGLSLYGSALRRLAERLTAQGMVALTLHYFDASGGAESPEVTPALFETWRVALSDALAFIATQPHIDPARIGVVGISLGGFVAGVEAVQNERIAALVSVSSGVSTWFPANPSRMPPLLIVHSRDDTIVPLSDALHLAEIARRLAVEPRLVLYDGKNHLLTGAVATAADAEIAAFLARVLRATAG
jgi:carboxymethylenebutenolidase